LQREGAVQAPGISCPSDGSSVAVPARTGLSRARNRHAKVTPSGVCASSPLAHYRGRKSWCQRGHAKRWLALQMQGMRVADCRFASSSTSILAVCCRCGSSHSEAIPRNFFAFCSSVCCCRVCSTW